jgi:ABC-2 type transport system ATP-binding protein
MNRDRLQMSTRNAEALLVRLLREDPDLSDIEVRRAGLAEAFTELTNADREAP